MRKFFPASPHPIANRRRHASLKSLLVAGALCAPALGAAHAATYDVSVKNANIGSFNADAATFASFPAGASATFQYSGALNFNDNSAQNSSNTQNTNAQFWSTASNAGGPSYGISGYSGSGSVGTPGNANFASLSGFLSSSMSASGFHYGEIMKIDLGVLSAGTKISVTHDDGASLYVGGSAVDTSQSGPTSAETFSDRLSVGGDAVLYYAELNGAPSVLNVATSVPEPTTWALMLLGFAALGFAGRRKAKRLRTAAAA